jgi:hydrogenase expression/formation protein HypC
MCLGIPGRVVDVYCEDDLPMAKVEFGGISKRVCLAHTPDAKPGDFVVVHVGFALSIIDPQEAQQVFEFLKRLRQLDELQADEPQREEAASHEIPG